MNESVRTDRARMWVLWHLSKDGLVCACLCVFIRTAGYFTWDETYFTAMHAHLYVRALRCARYWQRFEEAVAMCAYFAACMKLGACRCNSRTPVADKTPVRLNSLVHQQSAPWRPVTARMLSKHAWPPHDTRNNTVKPRFSGPTLECIFVIRVWQEV